MVAELGALLDPDSLSGPQRDGSRAGGGAQHPHRRETAIEDVMTPKKKTSAELAAEQEAEEAARQAAEGGEAAAEPPEEGPQPPVQAGAAAPTHEVLMQMLLQQQEIQNRMLDQMLRAQQPRMPPVAAFTGAPTRARLQTRSSSNT